MDHLQDLNPEQIAAVTTTEGAVRVIAGPGTGKTRTLTRRYAYLVDTLGVSPANVLCATFTNKAANEMKKRIRERLGDLDLGHISTIHAFCLKLLKEDIHAIGYPKNFIVLDKTDQVDIMDQIFEEMDLKMSDLTIKSALDGIIEVKKFTSYGYIENIHLLNNETLRENYSMTSDRAQGIFLRYLHKQKQSFGLDFNDLINFASYILENFPDIRQKWQKRLQYVMVDEFQDMSKRQYSLVDTLSGYHRNLFIVGDPDQTIYTWRGSHARLFLDFAETHEPCGSLSLPTNYRSTEGIIKAAGSLIAHNPDRLPYSQKCLKPGGPKPTFFRAKDTYAEANWVATKIKALLASSLALDDMAVIYRAHHFSRALEERLYKSKIPYKLLSGTAFYGRREIKDMISYLRMLTAADDMAFRRTIRVPSRKVGKKTLAFIAHHAAAQNLGLYQTLKRLASHPYLAKTGAPAYLRAIENLRPLVGQTPLIDLFQKLLDDTGYEAYLRLQGDQERLDNAAELKRAVADFGADPEATLEDFLNQAALFTENDNGSEDRKVKLMTIHAAKGLEFKAAFLVGLSEGSLPSRKALTPDGMAEERRLCYVAMTRAQDRLFLSNSSGFAHEHSITHTSRFVFEMGLANLDLENDPGAPPADYAQAHDDPSRPRLAPGQRVRHPSWGQGEILAVNDREANYVVRFDRLATPRTIRFDFPLAPADAPPPEAPERPPQGE
ncbi:MAG: UvrD-helicase domain-containing protein [Deltaproteobacteria bacterium]|jgi:DNA helicase-2/ATP-dependent DNA helicase PcrA|nr:UvrD-helicase domain-containing protein [Deltaproteobacteria bacterium]